MQYHTTVVLPSIEVRGLERNSRPSSVRDTDHLPFRACQAPLFETLLKFCKCYSPIRSSS
ncbi:predicted protein [Plenodomus lingam JN3]|uniref:Predicted protein n=1 Tax=Leptosphaeria maculans (strain JN3 / isolate v23.1.3 / race Av1-4-5-6-7-8) TaxID=985895 RepID=E5A7W3_LEPMJ|nr:predicted protein [Plenodomus lingam JN3]CBX99708.1 predicted protein [Plenodomus lingam JN3]